MRALLVFALTFLTGLSGYSDEVYSHLLPNSKAEWKKLKTFFEENGYVWIKNFYSPQQVLLIQDWAEKINLDAKKILTLMENGEDNIPNAIIVVPEANDRGQVCRTEDMTSFYPHFKNFIQGTLTSYIGAIFEEPYVLFKEKLNFKWPGGGAFLPHQDFPAFSFLGPRQHVNAMIAIDRASEENGCLKIALNWRKTFLNDSRIDSALLEAGHAILPYIEGGKNHGSIEPEFAEKITWLKLDTEPGDLILFDSFIPHYSEPNHSNGPRRALFFTYNRLKEGDFNHTYYFTKRNDPENPMFHFGTPTKARNK